MALTKVNSAGVKDNEIVNADIHSAANIAGTKLADNAITNAKLVNNAVTSDKIANNAIVNASVASNAAIAGSKLADDTIAEVKLDVSNAPSAGTFLQYKDNSDQLTWAQASSPEVYGFNTSGSNLIVTTTNGGADNISGAAYAAFEDVIYAATGFTFSLNTDGKLIATI
jgi:hypothetical protein